MLPISDPSTHEPRLLEQVDEALRAPHVLLGFKPQLERRFRTQTHRARRRSMQVAGVLMNTFPLLMLLADYFLIPDVFSQALWLRLTCVGVTLLLSILAFKLISDERAPEWWAIAIGLLAVGTNLHLLGQSNSPLGQLHLLGCAMVILYNNVILRPRFQLAAWATAAMLAGPAWVGLTLPEPLRDLKQLLPVLVAIAATASCSLYFLYQLEREERHNHLMSLRHRLLSARLATVNAELDQLARLDPLTLVANRRHADEHLGQLWQRRHHGQDHLAVMMIDIDHFKAYNDRYGHPAGDACLRAVAQALMLDLRRAGDLLARYGGEEFIAVLHGVPPDEALKTAERITQAIRDLNLVHEGSPGQQVTISVGLCCDRVAEHDLSLQAWVAAADQALYDAKRQGRNQVRQASILQGKAAA
ncbi:diguanylate cyclase [Aquabacterium sp.]|uniref:GGDEF domain-containing protein n=1 Tax=Aquabacterium sp. TaxID=1872578 RepID=UPI003D6D9FA4